MAFLRELERADDAVAVVLAELDELAEDCEAVRLRALELEVFFVRLPGERAAAAQAVEESRRRAVRAREALERAEGALAAVQARGDDETLAAARRAHVRARDTLAVDERLAAEAEERAARLEEEARAAEQEADALGRRAAELAAALRERPRLALEAGEPGEPGLAGVAEWGTRARAALLVARSQLASERDGLVRQANELGTLVLGEPLTAASAALVARRVERELGPG
ncbi:MAG TPA: hypothetical protein VFR63_15330 [Gaiellaceae bacterium]|nr:hypothetical protein [Gaiellaceae bacterium]